MSLPSLEKLPPSLDSLDLEGRRVLVRVDLGTTDERAVLDLYLHRCLPTLRTAIDKGARVLIAAHRPPPSATTRIESLAGPGIRLAELLGTELYLPEDVAGESARKVVRDLRNKQVCLLENLAGDPGEAGLEQGFSKQLAELCDVYVAEAFSVVDQRLASTTLLPRFVRTTATGENFRRELEGMRMLLERSPTWTLVAGSESVSESLLRELPSWLGPSRLLVVARRLAQVFDEAGAGHATTTAPTLLAQTRTVMARFRDQGVETARLSPPSLAPLSQELETRLSIAGGALIWGDLDAPAESQTMAAVLSALRRGGAFTAVVGEAAADAEQRLTSSLSGDSHQEKPALSEPGAATHEADPAADPRRFVSLADRVALRALRGEPLPGLATLDGLA